MSDIQSSSLQVECYACCRADEEPQRFLIGKREIGVESILDHWQSPEHRYFKLRGSDGGIYILRHDLLAIDHVHSGQHDQGHLSST